MFLREYYKDIPEIGRVLFRKNNKAKNLYITVNHKQEIKVTIPRGVKEQEVLLLILKKKDWIKKQVEKSKLNSPPEIYKFDEPIKTYKHDIVIVQEVRNDLYAYYKDTDIIEIRIPKQATETSEQVQNFIANIVIEAYRYEAKMIIPQRVKAWAEKLNIKYNKLFIKNNKTNWGSCSSVNNININLHVLRLPEHLIDYIIVHELTHVLHKNHSKTFWDTLSSFLNTDAKLLRKELKAYSTLV